MTGLAQLRREAGLAQKDVAKILGLAQSRISAIENSALPTLTVATLDAYLAAIGHSLCISTDSGAILRQVDRHTEAPTPS